jgi:exodeoxyribonuclease VII large subunit
LVGVGHEINESLADLVADVSAATPSNAAQILVPDKSEIIRAVHAQIGSLLPRILQVIDQQKQVVRTAIDGVFETIERVVEEQARSIGYLRSVLTQLDPNTVLVRGYALIRGTVKVGAMIEIETNKVIIGAEVKNVIKK